MNRPLDPVSFLSAAQQESLATHDAPARRLDLTPGILTYWRLFNRRKWLLLATTLIGLALAIAAVVAMQKIYRATATLVIENARPAVVSIEDLYTGVGANREYFLTQVEFLQSRDVAMRAIRELNLTSHPEFDPRQSNPSLLSRVAGKFLLPRSKELDRDELETIVYGRFAERVRVEPTKQSNLIRISFEAADRQLAADAANAIAQAYVQAEMDARQSLTQNANQWLNNRVNEMRGRVDASARALQTYREKYGLLDTKGVSQGGTSRQLEDSSMRLAEARARRAAAEEAYAQVRNVTRAQLDQSLPVASNPAVAQARSTVADLENKLADLGERFGPNHPQYLATVGDLKTAQQGLRRQIDAVVAGLAKEYQLARALERQLDDGLSRARGAVRDVNRNEIELGQLERELQANQQLYQTFLTKLKETSAASDIRAASARVVDPALPTSEPVKPMVAQILLASALAGLLLGLAASVLLEHVNNTIRSTSEVDEKLDVPMLAAVPKLDDSLKRHAPTLQLAKPESLFAESIRTASTSLALATLDQPNKIVLVTSSLDGEGKSTIAMNLALAVAANSRALLIDCDLRKPTVAARIGLPSGKPGLSDVVSGQRSIVRCLYPVADSSLRVLPAGSRAPNALAILSSQQFRNLLRELRTQFDTIILDSPPVHLVSDALVLAKEADGVALVVRSDRTQVRTVRQVIRRVSRTGASILGVIVNAHDFKKADRYHGESSGYRKYGYERAYG